MNGYTYKDAGVDLSKVLDLHDKLREILSPSSEKTVLGPGHYSGVVKVGDLYLGLHTDGVGTKVQLALQYQNFEPVGVDCVAMNVNDLVSLGLTPVAIVDYIAMESPSDTLIEGIARGLRMAAKEADVDVVGGETAIMPGVIKGFDLSCSALGVSTSLKSGSEVAPGDLIIAMESNGLHSNGFTLVRSLLEKGTLKVDPVELLKPTFIYVKPVLESLPYIKGVAHVTGGSFSKLRRITRHRLNLSIEQTQDIFIKIEKAGYPTKRCIESSIWE